MASQITRWDPFSSAVSLSEAMDRLFEQSFVWPRFRLNRDTLGNTYGMLPIDMYETADEIVVHAALPGVKPQDLNVQFEDGRLIVDAQLQSPTLENATVHYREMLAGQYHREVTLPVAVNSDKAEATLENGYLTLRLPKAEEVKPKKIQVKPAAK